MNRAARRLRRSQPAVSSAVRILEDVVGAPLFERTREGVTLTEKGQALYRHCHELTRCVDQLSRAVDPEPEAPLKVGSHSVLIQNLWPNFLRDFHTRHPEQKVTFESGRIDTLLDRLRQMELDLVVTVRPVDVEDLRSVPLYEGRLELYGPGESAPGWHAGAKNRIYTDIGAHVQQHIGIPFVLREAGLAQVSDNSDVGFLTAMSLAIRGEGLAFLPDRNAADKIKSGLLQRMPMNEGLYNLSQYGIYATFRKGPSSEGCSRLLDELQRSPFFAPAQVPSY